MAYAERYSYVFWWDNNDSNNKYKVSFLEDGYVGGVTTLIPSQNPFILSISGQKDTIDNPIFGSEARMEIRVLPEPGQPGQNPWITVDTNLLQKDYKDVIVKLIQDPDGTPVVKWTGFMLPTNASRNFSGFEKTYKIRAVDGLADLKNKYYSSDGTKTGSRLTGFADMLTIIKTALSKVADITELQLDFRIQCNTYSDQMTSSENPFKENEIVQELFSKEENGKVVFDTCYDVIEKILKPFYCGLAQSDGYYWIFCHNERTSFYFEYDWATLTQQSRTANTRQTVVIDATGASPKLDNLSQGNLYKRPALKTFDVNLFNKNYDPELIVNGGFDSDITGWTLGDAAASANGFSGISHISASGLGVLRAQWGGAASAGNYFYHTTNDFTLVVGGGAPTVTLSVRVELNAATPGGIAMPDLRFRLYNGTDTYQVGSLGYQAIIQIGGYYIFTETFDVTGLTVAGNKLEVEAQVTDANTTSVDFYFDSISLMQGSANEPKDWIYRSIRSTGNQTTNKEADIFIAEWQESDNDICAIKDSGGTYTSTWDRYNKTDTLSLIELFQLNVLNDNSTYINYIKTVISDRNETAQVHDLVFTNGSATGLSAYGRIVGFKKHYTKAEISYDLVDTEVMALVSDVSYNASNQKLTSEYGE